MNTTPTSEATERSCTAQLFPAGPPSGQWFPEQVLTYILVQHQVIVDSEHKLAVDYWRLGMALEVLRKTFNHGQWERFLKTSHLDKWRVFRARAIARTFHQESDLAGLTVQQAYDRRSRKRRTSTTVLRSSPASARFARFLDHVGRLAERFIDDAGFAEPAHAAALLPAVTRVLAKFARIRRLLAEQAGRAKHALGLTRFT